MSAHISSIGSPRHSTAKWPPTYAACARVAGVRWARRRAAGRGALGVLGACAPHLLGAPILPPRHILGARRLLRLVREDRVLVAARDKRPRRPAHELLGDGLEAHRRVAAVAVVAAVLPRVLPQDARARKPERAALRRRQQPQPPAARELGRHRPASDHEAPLLVAARVRRGGAREDGDGRARRRAWRMGRRAPVRLPMLPTRHRLGARRGLAPPHVRLQGLARKRRVLRALGGVGEEGPPRAAAHPRLAREAQRRDRLGVVVLRAAVAHELAVAPSVRAQDRGGGPAEASAVGRVQHVHLLAARVAGGALGVEHRDAQRRCVR